MATNNNNVSGWVGWVYFAGFMMLITGVLQMISGLVGLLNNKFYLAANGHLLVFNYVTWGWVELLLGLFVLLAGSAVLNGHMWGRVVAVILAVSSFVANFAFVSVYPVWSVIVMIVNVLIIYAITVHGSEA